MSPLYCVPSNFITNQRLPKFSLNNCAQSLKKTFMCPKFSTNPVLKHTKCHISIKFVEFCKAMFIVLPKIFALAPTNRRFTEKNQLSGSTGTVSLVIIWSITVVVLSMTLVGLVTRENAPLYLLSLACICQLEDYFD